MPREFNPAVISAASPYRPLPKHLPLPTRASRTSFTPSRYRRIDSLPGITEIRPGNYIFFDAFQAAIGSSRPDDIAYSVLTTVIGAYPDRNQLVVDAGALALSKDAGPTHIFPDCGFGIVTSVSDQQPVPGLKVVSLTQEYAILRSASKLDPVWQPGTRFRIFPNHSCLSAACFDRYHVVRGTDVVDEWKTVRGW